MFELPDDILRTIYEYDNTYISKYSKSIDEMNFKFKHNRVIDNMNIINYYYFKYQQYCTMNNNRFNSHHFYPIMPLIKYYGKFVIVHPERESLKRCNILKILKIP